MLPFDSPLQSTSFPSKSIKKFSGSLTINSSVSMQTRVSSAIN